MFCVVFFFHLLPTILTAVFPYPLKDFRSTCQKLNNNGNCDLQCRNFLPRSELSDCSSFELKNYKETFEFIVYDVSFKSIVFKEKNRDYYCDEWRKNLERHMRKIMGVEVEMLISDQELFNRAISCFEEGGICQMRFDFSITVAICPECVTITEAISRLADKYFEDMQVQIVAKEPEVTIPAMFLTGTVGCLLLVLSLFKVLVSISRKRKILSHPIWTIPKEEKTDENQFYVQNQLYFHQIPSVNYEKFLGSNQTSPNMSMTQADPLLRSPYVKQSQTTELHLLCLKDISEDQMIQEAEQIIYQKKVDLDAVTENAETAVKHAVCRGLCRLAKYLLDSGADGNIPDSSGYSLFHHAVSLQDEKMLHMLTQYVKSRNLDLDVLSIGGRTALMECALLPNQNIGLRMAQILIQEGAKLDEQGDKACKDFQGKTVLHFAAERGHNELVQLLIAKANEQEIPLFVDILDFRNNTALWCACNYRQVETVKILLDAGANAHLPALETSMFPIEIARKRGYKEIVHLLIEYRGTARNAKKKTGRSMKRPLYQNVNFSTPSSTESSPVNIMDSARNEPNGLPSTPSSIGSSVNTTSSPDAGSPSGDTPASINFLRDSISYSNFLYTQPAYGTVV